MLTAVRSDVGKVREINEDYVFLSEPYPNGLMIAIVADGMGGHLAGEIASKTAVDAIYQVLSPLMTESLTIAQYKDGLEQAIYQANAKVYQQSMLHDKYHGMGTTVVAAIVSPQWLILGHIGDSRAYLLNGENIRQLTADHSLVNELLKNGQISEEEAISHPQKNILTRALGTEENVKVDMDLIYWEREQTLILCTDGLTNHVSDEKIIEIVNQNTLLQEMADHFLSLANQTGGEDNISMIIMRHE